MRNYGGTVMFQRSALVVSLLSVVFLASSCGQTSASATVGKLEQAVLDAKAVTIDDVATLSGSTSTLAGVVGTSTANVSLTTSPTGGTVRILHVGNRFYVSGQTAALAALLGKSAASYASLNGEAVALGASDSPYKAISLSLSLEGLVNPYLAKVPRLSKLLATASSPASTVLSGPWTTSGPTNGWKGLTSLRIDPDTSLPRSGLVELHHGKGIATRAAVFRAWGTQPNVTAPTISIPFGSLPG